MSFVLFGESFITTIFASAVSSFIVSKMLSKDGIEITWNYILKPVGETAYKTICGKSADPLNTNLLLDKLPKGHVVFEVLEPKVDENGVVTRYIIFERKYSQTENEPVFL